MKEPESGIVLTLVINCDATVDDIGLCSDLVESARGFAEILQADMVIKATSINLK